MSPLGREDRGAARQGPLPARPGRSRGSLPGSISTRGGASRSRRRGERIREEGERERARASRSRRRGERIREEGERERARASRSRRRGERIREAGPDPVKARVLIRLKQSILDPQGTSVKRALEGLGFREVRDVRVGKVLDLDLDGESPEEARRRIEEMCARLLVNPVIEDFTVEVMG